VVKTVSFADDSAISVGGADGPHTDALDPSAPQPRQAVDRDVLAAAAEASVPSDAPDRQVSQSPDVVAALQSVPDDDAVPQFEQGMLQITAALTDSMRATRRLVTHSNSANGKFAETSASAPSALISEALASAAEQPASSQTKARDAAAISGSIDDVLAQRVQATEPLHGGGELNGDSGPSELAEARRAKLQRLRSRPKPQAPPSRKPAPVARPTSADARAVLHTPSSDASSDDGPLMVTADAQSDNDGVRHGSRGSDAENAQQRVAQMVEGAQVSQPPEEGAPWEEYVDFLEREVLDKASVSTSQPDTTSQAGGLAKAQSSSAERAMKELQVPPVDKFKKMKGKDAQEAMAAQLARIQAAAGACPLPCTCFVVVKLCCTCSALYAHLRLLTTFADSSAVADARMLLQVQSGGGRRSARGVRRPTC
jgi:hypothetical protein